MSEIDLPGIGRRELNLATCSYREYVPEMGVAVRTSVGGARFFRHKPLEYVKPLAPHGIFKAAAFEAATMDEKHEAYDQRLSDLGPEMLAELLALQDANPGKTLVLLCFENVHHGEECHRRWAADWFERELGLEVPELSDPNRPPPKPKGNGGGGGGAGGNVHEERAREKKATKLADKAGQLGLDLLALSALTDEGWDALAEQADCRGPSSKTIRRVLELASQHSQAA